MSNDFYSFYNKHEWTEYKKQVGRFYLYDILNEPIKVEAFDRLYNKSRNKTTFETFSGDF